GTLAGTARAHKLWKHTVFLVGPALAAHGTRSHLYHPGHFHGFRRAEAGARRALRERDRAAQPAGGADGNAGPRPGPRRAGRAGGGGEGAGDEPGVAAGADLAAAVRWEATPGGGLGGGEGVGVVTKAGLGIEVGEPAITATPRAMVIQAVGEVAGLGGRGVRV